MSATNSISPDKLFRLIGTANCPAIVDVRPDGDELLPAALRRPAETVRDWAGALAGRNAVIFCVHGHEWPREVEGRAGADDIVNLPRGAGRCGEDRRIFEFLEHRGARSLRCEKRKERGAQRQAGERQRA